MLSHYDKILLDVSGTLYTNKREPIKGSKEFINFIESEKSHLRIKRIYKSVFR